MRAIFPQIFLKRYEKNLLSLLNAKFSFLSGQNPTDSTDFKVVEIMPEFPGGDDSLLIFIYHNIRYPAIARENGIEGTGVVSFVIEKDGSITNEKVIRGLGGGIDEELLRLVRSFPKWKPGYQKGKPVKVQFNLPVRFNLDDETKGGVGFYGGLIYPYLTGSLNDFMENNLGGSFDVNFYYKKWRFDLEIGFARAKVKQPFTDEGLDWNVTDKVFFGSFNYGLGYNLPISENKIFVPYLRLNPLTYVNHSIMPDNRVNLDGVWFGVGLHYEHFLKKYESGVGTLVRFKTDFYPGRYNEFIKGNTIVFWD